MICPQCGADCPAEARFCVTCRYAFTTPAPAPVAAQYVAPAQPYPQPYGQPPPFGYAQPPPPPYGAPPAYGFAAPPFPPAAPYGAPFPPPYYPPYGAPPPAYGPGGFAQYPVLSPTPYPMIPMAEGLARASASRRWGAAFIDFVLLFSVWLVLLAFVRPTMQTGNGPPFLFITMLLGFGYYIVPDALGGATLGKLATRVRVVDINLNPASPLKIAVRSLELFLWVFLLGVIFLIAQILLAQKNGQALGDRMAGTYVVGKRMLATAKAANA